MDFTKLTHKIVNEVFLPGDKHQTQVHDSDLILVKNAYYQKKSRSNKGPFCKTCYEKHSTLSVLNRSQLFGTKWYYCSLCNSYHLRK